MGNRGRGQGWGLYLQAGLAVFLLPVKRDSLAARSSISRLVFSSVTATRSEVTDGHHPPTHRASAKLTALRL